jgi:hypothetical protein
MKRWLNLFVAEYGFTLVCGGPQNLIRLIFCLCLVGFTCRDSFLIDLKAWKLLGKA